MDLFGTRAANHAAEVVTWIDTRFLMCRRAAPSSALAPHGDAGVELNADQPQKPARKTKAHAGQVAAFLSEKQSVARPFDLPACTLESQGQVTPCNDRFSKKAPVPALRIPRARSQKITACKVSVPQLSGTIPLQNGSSPPAGNPAS